MKNAEKLFSRALLVFLMLAGCRMTCIAQATGDDRSVPAVKSQEQFDAFSRADDVGTPYPLPHILFVIDRRDQNRIYYVNGRKFKFHKDFVNGTYLSLERGRPFFENNYLKPSRRFILGTIAYQTPVKAWTFEFWEGDLITADQIKLTSDIINKTFFTKVAFKPNSVRQEEESNRLPDLARILQTDINKGHEYLPLNMARGLGRIHIIDKLDDHVEIGSNEIIILNEVPVHLPPVAGIITTQPSTPLSHINLLAKSWGVPNAYIKNANELLKQYDGWWVSFETKSDNYKIQRADLDQLKEYQSRLEQYINTMTPRFDLSVKHLAGLREQRAALVTAYGAKSANLGELINARLPGIIVPGGFTIPFYYFDQFMKENKFDDQIYEMLNDHRFVHDPAYRREQLKLFRERMTKGKMNERLLREVWHRAQVEFPEKGLFVRSSTNSEDLPNFNGAGLYNTVPNVRGLKELEAAIKDVWASVWNFEAYEARERAGIDHTKVYMAVLLQEGINADSAGVMITTDPFNQENKGAIYISAKRGLGIKVVEGQKIAEQVIFQPKANAVQVLTRSTEDSLLTFDTRGGVKEIPITGERAVLTDTVIRRLASAAGLIKKTFAGKEQDIEWVYYGGRIYIVQSRPFISGS